MPFQKGQSKIVGSGRKRGVKNKSSEFNKETIQGLINDLQKSLDIHSLDDSVKVNVVSKLLCHLVPKTSIVQSEINIEEFTKEEVIRLLKEVSQYDKKQNFGLDLMFSEKELTNEEKAKLTRLRVKKFLLDMRNDKDIRSLFLKESKRVFTELKED